MARTKSTPRKATVLSALKNAIKYVNTVKPAAAFARTAEYLKPPGFQRMKKRGAVVRARARPAAYKKYISQAEEHRRKHDYGMSPSEAAELTRHMEAYENYVPEELRRPVRRYGLAAAGGASAVVPSIVREVKRKLEEDGIITPR